jgi:hypothetical protein
MNNNWKLELHKLSLWNKVTRSDIGELSDFIEQELKLKDQEHKAELEIIKGEIERIPRNLYNGGEGDGYCQGLDDTISILDSYINKL